MIVAPPECLLAFMIAARKVHVWLATFVRQMEKSGSLVKSATTSLMLLTVKVTGAEALAGAGARGGAALASRLASVKMQTATTTRTASRRAIFIEFTHSTMGRRARRALAHAGVI